MNKSNGEKEKNIKRVLLIVCVCLLVIAVFNIGKKKIKSVTSENTSNYISQYDSTTEKENYQRKTEYSADVVR